MSDQDDGSSPPPPRVLSASASLSDVERRFAMAAAQMGNAVIVAAGHEASHWAELARPAASGCRIEAFGDPETDLADALIQARIGHIFLLRLTGQQVVGQLDDIAGLLAYARVGVISIGDIEVRRMLPAIAAKLTPCDYRLFGLSSDGGHMVEIRSWLDGLQSSQFVAVHRRVIDLLLHNDHRGLDLGMLCREHGIDIAGIIHLGAFEGEEAAIYRAFGAFPIVLVEANPAVYERLQAKVSSLPGVFAIHAAIADHDGPVTLHLSSDDQCGSILPLATIEQAIPSVVGVGTVQVPGRTVDSLIAEFAAGGHAAASSNILVSDIQGAELQALRGMAASLWRFDAILLELSFDELYAGCAQLEEIDDFLIARGFTRVAMVSAWHPSWADAFYRRR